MLHFVLRRIAWFAVTLFTVVTVSFVLMRSVPGGPFDGDRSWNATVERNLEARYHLDWPLWRQYLHYVGPLNLDEHGPFGDGTRPFGGVLTGDLGPSLSLRDYSVNDIIAESLPISVTLGSLALAWAIVVGVALGVVAALLRESRTDFWIRFLATLGVALPNFVIASSLILLFVFVLPWFPVAGWGSLRHLVLPAVALGAPFCAYIVRLTRTGMLEILTQDWIRTARSKGLPLRLIVWRHALKGGLLPVVSYLGPATAGILTGSLVIEKIFAIPGTGTHFIRSALNRDYTLALGVTILYTVLVYGLNLVVDIAYGLLDPRIDLEEA